ncbi:hypothetical protein DM02DRAFT_409787 [Periconia macrospinosa]|uniref:Uncharacterized protein n=1 Tax=Periconia macrospinosa TaxID=97972 RepID=A0A2V1DS88_9PLEO|nr:hypothetical protein DM02DRAFT_409787 [Periconia macrospinosa]
MGEEGQKRKRGRKKKKSKTVYRRVQAHARRTYRSLETQGEREKRKRNHQKCRLCIKASGKKTPPKKSNKGKERRHRDPLPTSPKRPSIIVDDVLSSSLLFCCYITYTHAPLQPAHSPTFPYYTLKQPHHPLTQPIK